MCNMAHISMASEDGDRCQPQCTEEEDKAEMEAPTGGWKWALPGLEPCSFQVPVHV